ncbi:type III pantothenate kinase [bacterium]|nr:type III pantothenate kinase [bacterium]
MLTLLYDLGNSRVKLALLPAQGEFNPATIVTIAEAEFRANPTASLKPFGKVDEAVGCSTNPAALEALTASLAEQGIEPTAALDRCPLAIDYGEELGDDRVLAAWLAYKRLGAPVAVVGCGTAVTVDLLVLREGLPHFLGGAIMAGERLLLNALGQLGGLPELEPSELILLPPGQSTTSCLLIGASSQVEGGLRLLLTSYAAEFPELEAVELLLLLHGGDADRYLRSHPGAVEREEFAVLAAIANLLTEPPLI